MLSNRQPGRIERIVVPPRVSLRRGPIPREGCTDVTQSTTKPGKINSALAISYAAVAYVLFLASFLYVIGFLGNIGVPRSVDRAVAASTGHAVLVDLLLLGLFGVQHSVMARPGFKSWWTRIVPQPIERSTYVLISSLVLLLLYWQWRFMPPAMGCEIPGGSARTLGGVLGRVGDRAALDIHDRPLRPVRLATGVSGMARTAVFRRHISHAAALPTGASPVDARLRRRVLGDADHDSRAPTLRCRHNWLHSDRAAAGGARPDHSVGCPVPRLPPTGADAVSVAQAANR